MKKPVKIGSLLTAAALLLGCLTGCGRSKIAVRDPIILGEGRTRLPEGGDVAVYLEMTEGEYFQSPSPDQSPYVSNFRGDFRLRVVEPFEGKTLSTAAVSFDGEDALAFDRTFSLVFGDYNGDGSPDFTLGQRAGSTNMLYQLYSIGPGGEIEELSFSDGHLVFLALAPQDAFSLELETREGKMAVSYYDTALAGIKELLYQWEDGAFRLVP